MIDLLQILICITFGVLLGFGLKHPALVERERIVRQQLRRAKATLAQARVDRQIAEGALRMVQAVRAQTNEMFEFANRAPQVSPLTAQLERSPVFDSMTAWLRSTAAMPVLEPRSVESVDQPQLTADPAEAAEVAEPQGARHQLAKRAKVAVKAMPEAPAQLVEVAS